MFCVRCGNALREGMRFCTACGQPVNRVEMVPEPSPGAALPADTQQDTPHIEPTVIISLSPPPLLQPEPPEAEAVAESALPEATARPDSLSPALDTDTTSADPSLVDQASMDTMAMPVPPATGTDNSEDPTRALRANATTDPLEPADAPAGSLSSPSAAADASPSAAVVVPDLADTAPMEAEEDTAPTMIPPSVAARVATPAAAAAAAPPRRTSAHAPSVSEDVRASLVDAGKALVLFARDPVGGLARSFFTLGERQATHVGIVFAIVFEMAVVGGTLRTASQLLGMFSLDPFGGDPPASVWSLGQVLKAVVVGLIPFGSLLGAAVLVRTVFGGKGRLAGDVYTAGASLLPAGVFFLLVSFVGFGSVDVSALLGLFALTYTILLLYSGCANIARVPDAAAAPAVPIMLIVAGWLTRVAVALLW